MTNVYLLREVEPYEGDYTVGVFATVSAAKARVNGGDWVKNTCAWTPHPSWTCANPEDEAGRSYFTIDEKELLT